MSRRGRLRDRDRDEQLEGSLQQVWAGVDIGKSHHHAVVIDGDGRRLLSRRVANDEVELRSLVGDVLRLAGQVIWAGPTHDLPGIDGTDRSHYGT
jgi:hypothetical protein